MRRTLAALATAGALLLTPVTACGAETTDADIEFADGTDCDANDRRKKEMPDCGRKVNGKYREWSWVRDGKSKPPSGWKPASESSSAGKPAPRSTGRKSTTGDGSKSKSGTSRNSGTTRRR